jgi:NADH-quinone oxidoreductase subunit F
MSHILLRHRDISDIADLKAYKKNGGLEAFKNAVTKMTPAQVIDVVKNSGLRGRGGAGFPTGTKWSFIDNKNWPHYVVANADESEPGNPLQFLEGLAIASYAVGANVAYVYLRGEFWQLGTFLDEKIAELEKEGFLGDKLFGGEYSLRIYTHLGAGAYI